MSVESNINRFEKSFRLAAPRGRVFEALTEPAHLRQWFAEQCEVEPRVGGAYRFWGSRTPWCEQRVQADQRITQLAAPELLAFSWGWRGCPGEVTLRLSEINAQTQVAVEHVARGRVWKHSDDAVALLGDFWILSIGNLREYLNAGAAARYPSTQLDARDVVISLLINAEPAAIYRALTDPQQLNRWLSKAAQIDLRPGGVYRYGWSYQQSGVDLSAGPTRILELIPNRLLVTDWKYRDEPDTVVRWELEPLGAQTRVTIRHSRTIDPDEHPAYGQGWSAFLVALKALLETPDNHADSKPWITTA